MDIHEIKSRSEAIRLQGRVWAQSAGVHPNTITHVLRGAGTQTFKLKAVTEALITEELRLRDHLLALHPVQAREPAEAAE